jgi:hypothetical protein
MADPDKRPDGAGRQPSAALLLVLAVAGLTLWAFPHALTPVPPDVTYTQFKTWLA